jgi:hypothetical protein
LTTDLPPELTALASLVDAQPAPVREALRYCLALAMVEAGKACLVGQEPGEAGAVCTFETVAGEQFSMARPAMSKEVKEDVKEMLRAILEAEVGL